jgi:hypothetical protein
VKVTDDRADDRPIGLNCNSPFYARFARPGLTYKQVAERLAKRCRELDGATVLRFERNFYYWFLRDFNYVPSRASNYTYVVRSFQDYMPQPPVLDCPGPDCFEVSLSHLGLVKITETLDVMRSYSPRESNALWQVRRACLSRVHLLAAECVIADAALLVDSTIEFRDADLRDPVKLAAWVREGNG